MYSSLFQIFDPAFLAFRKNGPRRKTAAARGPGRRSARPRFTVATARHGRSPQRGRSVGNDAGARPHGLSSIPVTRDRPGARRPPRRMAERAPLGQAVRSRRPATGLACRHGPTGRRISAELSIWLLNVMANEPNIRARCRPRYRAWVWLFPDDPAEDREPSVCHEARHDTRAQQSTVRPLMTESVHSGRPALRRPPIIRSRTASSRYGWHSPNALIVHLGSIRRMFAAAAWASSACPNSACAIASAW